MRVGPFAGGIELTWPAVFPLGRGRPLALEPDRTLVLDIETGGFAGTPVFLIGVLLPDCGRIVQLLARDYPEERAILRGLGELTAERSKWITFNGRTFDEPFVRERAIVHRVSLPAAREHLDLLPLARRRWRGQVPNCRLATLERVILQRVRVDDVPGSDVPDLFHYFIRTGNPGPLRPVLEHNRLDLVACAELVGRLAEAE